MTRVQSCSLIDVEKYQRECKSGCLSFLDFIPLIAAVAVLFITGEVLKRAWGAHIDPLSAHVCIGITALGTLGSLRHLLNTDETKPKTKTLWLIALLIGIIFTVLFSLASAQVISINIPFQILLPIAIPIYITLNCLDLLNRMRCI